MRNYIIISKEQAEKVRGRHGKYSALEPVEFPDGMFGIPERCLDDPEFADIKETLVKYQKEGIVQDITDLNEKGLNTTIQKDQYYLSKEYWVVKALTSEKISISNIDKLTDLPDKFLIREDIATLVNVEKDAQIKPKEEEKVRVARKLEVPEMPEVVPEVVEEAVAEPVVEEQFVEEIMEEIVEKAEEVVIEERPVKKGFFGRLWDNIKKIFTRK